MFSKQDGETTLVGCLFGCIGIMIAAILSIGVVAGVLLF